MNLILLFPEDEVGEGRYRIDDHRAEHVRSVLRAETGDIVRVGLLDGPAGDAKIEQYDGTGVILRPCELKPLPDTRPHVSLICALPRPQTLKKVLGTAAQMGVAELYFIRANRVERSFFQSTLLNEEVYRPFLLEGLAQAQLTRLPDVSFHDRFRVFFEDTWPKLKSAQTTPSKDLVANMGGVATVPEAVPLDAEAIAIAIGPEGGWVPFELELMDKQGFTSVRLARWPLRVETAVTAALAQLELTSLTHR